MIVAAFGLESHTECRPARPAVVGPAAARAARRRCHRVRFAVAVALRGMQIGIGAARQSARDTNRGTIRTYSRACRAGPTGSRGNFRPAPRDSVMGPAPPPLYGLPLKFACLLLSRSPNAVAVVVPARHAYSHCASVGSRNSQSLGRLAACRLRSVSLRQKSSASAKLTLPTGKSSPAGSSTVSAPGNAPATRFQSPCVVSYFAIQKPLRQRHLDLIFARSPLRFASRAAHDEAAGRTPAEIDRVHSCEPHQPRGRGTRLPGPCRPRERGDRRDDAAEERSTRHLAHSIRSSLVRLPLRIAALSASLRNFAFRTRSTVTGQLNGTSVP